MTLGESKASRERRSRAVGIARRAANDAALVETVRQVSDLADAYRFPGRDAGDVWDGWRGLGMMAPGTEGYVDAAQRNAAWRLLAGAVIRSGGAAGALARLRRAIDEAADGVEATNVRDTGYPGREGEDAPDWFARGGWADLYGPLWREALLELLGSAAAGDLDDLDARHVEALAALVAYALDETTAPLPGATEAVDLPPPRALDGPAGIGPLAPNAPPLTPWATPRVAPMAA